MKKIFFAALALMLAMSLALSAGAESAQAEVLTDAELVNTRVSLGRASDGGALAADMIELAWAQAEACGSKQIEIKNDDLSVPALPAGERAHALLSCAAAQVALHACDSKTTVTFTVRLGTELSAAAEIKAALEAKGYQVKDTSTETYEADRAERRMITAEILTEDAVNQVCEELLTFFPGKLVTVNNHAFYAIFQGENKNVVRNMISVTWQVAQSLGAKSISIAGGAQYNRDLSAFDGIDADYAVWSANGNVALLRVGTGVMTLFPVPEEQGEAACNEIARLMEKRNNTVYILK